VSEDQTPRQPEQVVLQSSRMNVGPLMVALDDDGTMFHNLHAIDSGWSHIQSGHDRLSFSHHAESRRDRI
jgi:hypothetical protein